MRLRTIAGVAGATLASAVAFAAPAHADTYRGAAALGTCQILLYSTYSGGHDYVKYAALNPGQWGCGVFLRTWIGPNHYDHDAADLPAFGGGVTSAWYYDAGVKTQACIQMSSDDIQCTATY